MQFELRAKTSPLELRVPNKSLDLYHNRTLRPIDLKTLSSIECNNIPSGMFWKLRVSVLGASSVVPRARRSGGGGRGASSAGGRYTAGRRTPAQRPAVEI